MKYRIFTLIAVLGLVLSVVGVSPVNAAAYGTSFITSITYQNIGNAPASIMVDFYEEAAPTPFNITLPALPVGAGSSLYLGSVNGVTAGFRGSAVMSSSQPLAATLVQLPTGTTTVRNRPLSNGFSGGAPYVLIPTVLKNTFSTNTVFTVQNADSVAANVTVRFVPAEGGAAIDVPIANLPANAAKYFDMGQMAQLGAAFNGSVQIFSADVGGAAGSGKVVATSMEMATNNDNVYAFEGASETGTKVYMPSAFCNFGAGGLINSFYAVQNTSESANASVTVKYSSGASDGPFTIAPGKKQSVPGCGVVAGVNQPGFIGSAVIESTGAQIVAIGKITGRGLSTAFLGLVDGASTVALPYVRWTVAKWVPGGFQRGNIAIQNVGASTLPANSVSVEYYDKDGNKVGTHTIAAEIPVGGKVNSNPTNVGAMEFGYTGTQIGGGAIVKGPSGSKLAVIVRIESVIPGGTVGEDYNGIPVLP